MFVGRRQWSEIRKGLRYAAIHDVIAGKHRGSKFDVVNAHYARHGRLSWGVLMKAKGGNAATLGDGKANLLFFKSLK